jgi:predicted nucleic acid-binding protein
VFLDTNFLIDLEAETAANRLGPARRFLARHRDAPVVVSVIALGELAAGMDDNEAARLFLAGFRIVTLKPEIALETATVDRELMPSGNRLGENDTWLALCSILWHSARHQRCRLCTRARTAPACLLIPLTSASVAAVHTA